MKETSVTVTKPILSICIPTYNRSKNLDLLLSSLIYLKMKYKEEIEVLLSDNASNDHTWEIIQKYASILSLNAKSQAYNIGGTLNIISVASSINGNWGILIGDDDKFNTDGFDYLINRLRSADLNTWFLVESSTPIGNGYLSVIDGEIFSTHDYRRVIINKGLDPYGFMGTHVFPRLAAKEFAKLNKMNSMPWPHVAVFIRCLVDANIKIELIRKITINQAFDGTNVFWKSGDWARIRMARIKILKHCYYDKGNCYIFISRAMFRELYRKSSIVGMMVWKLQEPEDFAENSIKDYSDHYKYFESLFFLVIPHFIILVSLKLIPWKVYFKFIKLINRHNLYYDYLGQKHANGCNNAINRGI